MSPASSPRSASRRSSSASRCRTRSARSCRGSSSIFEAPFELGDWIETGGGPRGQIIEVNWRAVHLDTGNGIVVMPTAELAEGSFTNLSRSPEPYAASAEFAFGTDDPPGAGARAARRGRARHPARLARSRPERRRRLDGREVRRSRSRCRIPGDKDAVLDAFLTRLWYAARRADLHLDGDMTDDWQHPGTAAGRAARDRADPQPPARRRRGARGARAAGAVLRRAR